MKVTPMDLRQQRFKTVMRGYDRGEVQAFLLEVADDYENALQRALEVDGTAWVSVTTLRGRTYLRAGIVNYLSTRAEVDALIAALRRLSEGVLEELDRR